MRVYVIARDIQRHDAVGNFCRQLQCFLSANGYSVCLAAESCHVDDRSSIAHPSTIIPQIGRDDVTFFHFSTEDPAFAAVAALDNPKILYFHNITPARFFEGIDTRAAQLARAGLDQRPLATKFDLLVANSRATARVLCEGLERSDQSPIHDSEVITCPPFIGIDRWDRVKEERTDVAVDGKTVLYVGRLSPHKRVRQLVEGFAMLAEQDDHVTFVSVGGSPNSADSHALHEVVATKRPSIQKRIQLVHGISDGGLKSIYGKAGVCTSMSEHEGFGVPLVDAMVFDKPLVINREPGMIETAGDAALVVDSSSPAEIANALGVALNDDSVRGQLASARAERLRMLHKLVDGQLILDAIGRARILHRARIV